MEQLGLPVYEICDKIRYLIQDNENKAFGNVSGNYHHETLYSLKTTNKSPVMELNFFLYLGTGYRDYTLIFETNWYNANKLNPSFSRFHRILPVVENKFLRRIEFNLVTSAFTGFESESLERPLGLKFVNCIFDSDRMTDRMKEHIYENCEFINA